MAGPPRTGGASGSCREAVPATAGRGRARKSGGELGGEVFERLGGKDERGSIAKWNPPT